MALLSYEAELQHDPEHNDSVAEVLESLQKQLNVRSFLKYLNGLIFYCALLAPHADVCYHHGVNTHGCVPLTAPFLLPHLCRLGMVTWFACGSWLGNVWLNMPPPNAPGQTAGGFAGLFREELHVT